jgi:hypothetical protein
MRSVRFAFAFCLFLSEIPVWAQQYQSNTASPQSRIVERVNESALVTLRGNTHPLAQSRFDQGIAPPDLPMARMLLVLRRSAEQESALQKLLDDQQDKASPQYHQWLTPDEYGRQFGPSDQDIQVVTAWLVSHGFQVGGISQGRTVIEVSGTASQVQQAFHTEIHKYVVNGEEHWANASDPQIPAALSPVIEGVDSLHNFPKKPTYRFAGRFSKGGTAGRLGDLGPEFTTNDTPLCGPASCYFVSPYDFAVIYNVAPLWTAGIDGTGQSIAIVNESNINVQDVRDFRNLFVLPSNDPQIILNGPDPGIVQGVESEADLDVEWSGAVAKGATIKLVVTAPTNSTEGVDLSAVYAVENNVAPIISESFGECELFLGNAGNSFQNAIRQQAAAQGITFINSSGDEGSARCDPYSGSLPAPATHGLAVSGLASSPYGVAVGGTDFLNFGSTYNLNSPSPYWGSANDPQHQASALAYVPETTWNDTCTNNVFVFLGAGANPEASCNNSKLVDGVQTSGGGGGKGSCTISDGVNPSSCSGGYAKPSWQSSPGVPADAVRDIPDVSLFASPGFMNSSYILCESDQLRSPQTCSLNSPFNTFLGIGGTSASAPAFAGIMALVNQFTGSSGQGNANYVLYEMASSSAQTSQDCGATSSPSTTGCIFYDVTTGTNAVPCANGSPDCTTSNMSDAYGVLSGYGAGAGYDLATGLGSVNAFNLVHNWIQPTTSSTTTLSLNNDDSVNITHGQNVSFSVSVTPSAAPGVVSLMGSPGGSSFVPLASFPLQNGTARGTTASLAGGTSYAVKAHYPGDGTYKPSESNSVTVTVNPEPSKTLITVPVFDPDTGLETGNTPTSVVYGTPVGVRVDVGNVQAVQIFPEHLVCAPLACPTGNVTLTDTLNGNTSALSLAGGFALNSGGFVEDDAVPILSGGTHQLTAGYPGDSSYDTSMGNYTLTVTPAPIHSSWLSNPPYPLLVGTPETINAVMSATNTFPGSAPTGTMTFYDGTAPISGTVTYFPSPGSRASPASLSANLTATFTTSGSHQISVKYSGDANYGPATAPTVNISFVFGTSVATSANATTINLGQSVTITATATGSAESPAMTGSFQFLNQLSSPIGSPVTPTLGRDANGNQVLTAAVTISPQVSDDVQAIYSGDSNFASSGGTIIIHVIVPDFSMIPASPNVTITSGQPFSTGLTVTPLSSASSSVALTCSAPIAEATCSFNPVSPVSLANGATASTMLMIATLPPSSNPTAQFVAIRRLPKKWLPPPDWRMLGVADAIAILLFSLWTGRKWHRMAKSLGMACLLCLVLGCGTGGGSGTGGGGGGGSGGGGGPVATSLTLTTSALKLQFGATVTFTATVNSTQTATGTVSLLDQALMIDVGAPFTTGPVVNGTAIFQVSNLPVGTNTITAVYSGDPENQASQTKGSINEVITGTVQILVTGTTSNVMHNTFLNATIQ